MNNPVIEAHAAKILLVDDRSENLLALESVLSGLNCTIVTALSGYETLSLVMKEDFALILLDVRMPDMTGFEVAELLRGKRSTQHIPIIFVTAQSKDQAFVFKGYEAGAVDYLLKPVDPDILRNKVNVFLELDRQKKLLQRQTQRLEQNMRELKREISQRKKTEDTLRKYTERLRILHEIDQAILESKSPKHIAEAALIHIQNLIDCQQLNVVEIDQTTQEIIVLAVYPTEITTIEEGRRYPLTTFPINWCDASGKGKIINDLAAVAEQAPIEHALFAVGLRSYFAIPLVAQGEVIGALNFGAYSPDAFQAEHLEIAHEVAATLGVAIRQARLREQVQRYTEELEQRVVERTSELQAANIQLAHASQMKNDFLATVSHELRTPLNCILGFSGMLNDDMVGTLNDKQRQYMRAIESSGQNLLTLINDILDASQIEAGKLELSLAPIALETACQTVIEGLKSVAQKKRLQMSFSIDQQATTLRADELRLKQILGNLLSNAVKFTPNEGKIGLDVTYHANDNAVSFTVWDTGIGIAQENINRLFQPFSQLDSSLARKYEGTGLGLALVKWLTELHGGTISVESELNVGSRFTVSIPHT